MNFRDIAISLGIGFFVTFLTAIGEVPEFLLPFEREEPVSFDEFIQNEFRDSSFSETPSSNSARSNGSSIASDDYPVKLSTTETPEQLTTSPAVTAKKITSNVFPFPEGVIVLSSAEGDYYFKKTLVTKAEYQRFDSRYIFPETLSATPVNNIPYSKAIAYCRYWGKTLSPPISGRLPSLSEWKIAARGENRAAFFGTKSGQLDRTLANYGSRLCCGLDDADGYEGASEVTAFPPNSFGLYDMAGNVWEWTGTKQAGHPVIAGGSFLSPPDELAIDHHWLKNPHRGYDDVGFRCAADFLPVFSEEKQLLRGAK